MNLAHSSPEHFETFTSALFNGAWKTTLFDLYPNFPRNGGEDSVIKLNSESWYIQFASVFLRFACAYCHKNLVDITPGGTERISMPETPAKITARARLEEMTHRQWSEIDWDSRSVGDEGDEYDKVYWRGCGGRGRTAGHRCRGCQTTYCVSGCNAFLNPTWREDTGERFQRFECRACCGESNDMFDQESRERLTDYMSMMRPDEKAYFVNSLPKNSHNLLQICDDCDQSMIYDQFNQCDTYECREERILCEECVVRCGNCMTAACNSECASSVECCEVMNAR
jgi:hypothetical protein